ncbi:TonB-dependent siderophore receptor [Thalassotalea sp. PS06]|uniref:TonB-dependent siderophore receptor n=1 Tax=Thalassotalea sp. PS06 TaxID=2594005 RepID=UPI001164555F|nr:TonB-dependent receptor [Thalassotalea sp. PS06]QDP01005.1 TonB-dependent receptor [Thalassotalea sp. PS06]
MNRKPKNLFKTTVALAVANALLAGNALAENESEQDIEKIEVTATKRVTSIQEVPLAVTAIGGDELVDMQITDILSIEKAIPGVTVASFGNNPQVILRGAGSAGTTDIAVPIYHNNMYLPTTGQALAGYMDVERIEALRGPQGTLFGRNTFGGLINVITKKPDTEEFDFGAAITVGDYGLLKTEGFVNVPLGDKVAFRLTAADEQRDGYVENINNPDGDLKDSDYTYVRGQLLFTPTDDLSINLTMSHWKDTGNGSLNWAYKAAGIPLDKNDPTKINAIDGYLDPRMGIYVGCEGEPDRAGGRSQAGNVCAGDASASIVSDPRKIDYDYTPIRELEETAVYLNIDWEVANHSLVLNAAAFDYQAINLMDAEFSSMASWVDGTYGTTKSEQVDFTISSTFDGPLQYTLGAYYFDSQDPDNKSAYLFGSLTESWYAYAGATPETPSWAYWNREGRGGTKSTALYGQATYSLTDKLNATAGIRYTEDDRQSQRSNSLAGSLGWGNWDDYLGPELPSFTYVDGNGDALPTEVGKDENMDYRLGVDYQINDDVMVYASYSTAYIAGATDAATQKLLDPQTNKSYEAGFKSTLFDGDFRLNGAIFNAKYEGLTTTAFIEQGDTGVAVATQVPGGSINSRGIELEGFWDVTDDLVVDFGVSVDMSEYDEFVVNAGNLVINDSDGNPVKPIGSEVIDGGFGFVMDGENTPYTPDLTVGVGVSYFFDLGDMGTIKPYVHTYYNSGYMTNRAPAFFGEQDAYAKVDLSVKWESVDGDFTVQAYVNNATDELIQTYTEILSRARVAYDYAAPRNMGIRFGYNF